MEGRSDRRLGQLELVVGASRTIAKAEEEVLLAATERADAPKRLGLYLHFQGHLPQRAHRTALSGKAGNIERPFLDRKSTRLNSSHANTSYAVFCLKT